MLNHLDSLAQALVEAAIENGIRPRDLMGVQPLSSGSLRTVEERIAALAYEPDVAKAIALIHAKGGTVDHLFPSSRLPAGRATAMAVVLCSLWATLQGQSALGRAIAGVPKHDGPTLAGEPIVPGMRAMTSTGEVTVLGVHGPNQNEDYLLVYQYQGGVISYTWTYGEEMVGAALHPMPKVTNDPYENVIHPFRAP